MGYIFRRENFGKNGTRYSSLSVYFDLKCSFLTEKIMLVSLPALAMGLGGIYPSWIKFRENDTIW